MTKALKLVPRSEEPTAGGKVLHVGKPHRERLANVYASPFRDFARNPLRAETLTRLEESIAKTGFWDYGIQARARKGGGFEIAFGHHRLAALRNLGADKVGICVSDLDDAAMLKMLALENAQDYGASPVALAEVLRATVLAIAERRVRVVSIAPAKGKVVNFRYAPHFLADPGTTPDPDADGIPYTAESLVAFLGLGDARAADAALDALAREFGEVQQPGEPEPSPEPKRRPRLPAPVDPEEGPRGAPEPEEPLPDPREPEAAPTFVEKLEVYWKHLGGVLALGHGEWAPKGSAAASLALDVPKAGDVEKAEQIIAALREPENRFSESDLQHAVGIANALDNCALRAQYLAREVRAAIEGRTK